VFRMESVKEVKLEFAVGFGEAEDFVLALLLGFEISSLHGHPLYPPEAYLFIISYSCYSPR
jgi:hypothetical protein